MNYLQKYREKNKANGIRKKRERKREREGEREREREREKAILEKMALD